jgi:hypothetical protein
VAEVSKGLGAALLGAMAGIAAAAQRSGREGLPMAPDAFDGEADIALSARKVPPGRGKDRPWRYLRSAVEAPRLSLKQYLRLQSPDRRKAKRQLLLSKTVHLGHLGQPVLTGKQFRRIEKKIRRMQREARG